MDAFKRIKYGKYKEVFLVKIGIKINIIIKIMSYNKPEFLKNKVFKKSDEQLINIQTW
jgi:hypothetical protein